jgi:cytochrome c oxidase subunit IV
MPGRALRATSRIAFVFCGLISLFTGVPYAMLRGVGLPVQSEWVLFAVALAVIGVGSVTLGVLPRSWIAKGCRKDQDDQRLFSVLLKVLAILAGVFYLVAVFAYFSPNRWNLNPQFMLALCPMYLVKMTFDPSPLAIFLLLAPMNATVFGSLGLTAAYAWLCFQGHRSSQGSKTD